MQMLSFMALIRHVDSKMIRPHCKICRLFKRFDSTEVTVLNPSDLFGKVKTCFSQKRYGRVID
jgi:hypothetical protein